MLYTLGSHGWQPEALYDAVRFRQAMLVDIRRAVYSRYLWKRQQPFLAALPGQYLPLPQLGDLHERATGASSAIADYEHGREAITSLLQQWPTLVLMCACKDLDACHRSVVSTRLAADLSVAVEHLFPTPAQRRTKRTRRVMPIGLY